MIELSKPVDAAGAYYVPPDIHEADHIFNFIANIPAFPTRPDAVQEYFRNGRESAERLKTLLSELGGHNEPVSLLEFASGYGCVTRHLKLALPSTRIVSCDIHPEAIDFIERTMRIDGLLSRTVPEEANFGGQFDVVFALSFFSHMPKETWGRWLRKLVAGTKPGGLIIFTTHGAKSAEIMSHPPLDVEGFWFSPNSEQADLKTADYGTAITSFDFAYSRIALIHDARLIQFREGFWWRHQDLFVLRRLNGSKVANEGTSP
jgi:cyclopropane fatty-acyl-phospholipid synthase-like methyltransferase